MPKGKPHSPVFLAAVAALYPHHSRQAVVDQINARFGTQMTLSSIKSIARRCGLRQSAATRQRCRRLMPPAHVARLQELYRTLPAAACAAKLNDEFGTRYKPFQVKNTLRLCGIRAPADKPNAGQFQFSPTNSYTPPKGHHFCPEREFKKGHTGVPSRRTPIGHERMSDGVLLIKIKETCPYTGRPSRYVRKARWVWEQVHGAIPPGARVVQVDGDATNCDPDNLTLMTKGEVLALNSSTIPGPSHDPDINQARIALARLRAAIGQRQNTRQNTRQKQ